MNFLPLTQYNLEKTLLGGQSFAWNSINNSYYGCITGKIIKITPQKQGLEWQTYPKKDDIQTVQQYLNLSSNYQQSIDSICKDPVVKTAVNKLQGLRILKQDLHETIISFIISANNNIPSIKRGVANIRKTFGEKIIIDGLEFYTFPTIDKLAVADLETLKATKIGFRAKYIKQSAIQIQKNWSSELFSTTNEAKIHKQLTSLSGVGNKIADCVKVFSLGISTVTPIDVWMKRILHEHYGVATNSKYEVVKKWCVNKFGENTSLAGQFLFEYYRK